MSADFSVDCECGRQIKVAASQAGTEIPCDCGRLTSVPLLSKLRTSSGLDAYESGIVGTINRMIAEGELPWGDECAISGLPTLEICELKVHCEKQWTKTDTDSTRWFLFVAILLSPFLFFRVWLRNERTDPSTEVHGRDTVVRTPLRVRKEFAAKLGRMNQRKLKRLLKTVPIYEALLKEYPGSTVLATRDV
jgi:hypothetical protein